MIRFSPDHRPIGVFDSGVGGLTVLRAMMDAMPGENFLYLGDTARVPYGTKSAETICTYSLGLADVLLQNDVKMIVIACNTASAHATQLVAEKAQPIPVIGMIGPAAEAAAQATRTGKILVMGTQSTIHSRCYQTAIHALDPALTVTGVACQLLVALAEEGWVDGPIARDIVARYIGAHCARENPERPDTIILGCTHFPLLRDAVAEIAGPGVTLIDNGAAATRLITGMMAPGQNQGSLKLMATDSIERFAPAAAKFLGRSVDPTMITHIDLNDYKTYSPHKSEKEAKECST